ILIVAGIISNFSNKRIPETKSKPKPIKWVNLWLFILLFILAGIFSGIAKAQDWEYGRLMILFENFYRFGTIVFGGGQVLVPMMLYQFVNRPIQLGQEPLLSSVELLTGYGMVQAVPGPVFSICSFAGGMIMSPYGIGWQIMGCLVATIGVFLPSTLLLFFLFPL